MKKNSPKGFTIIETMIVLAIGGLIISVVFLAIPQLQRSSRDQARKSTALRIKSEIENYANNNAGDYPFNNAGDACLNPGDTGTAGDWTDFYSNYLTKNKINLADPSNGKIVIECVPHTAGDLDASNGYLTAYAANLPMPEKGALDIVTNAACSSNSVAASTAANSYAIIIGLENAGSRYCIDNS